MIVRGIALELGKIDFFHFFPFKRVRYHKDKVLVDLHFHSSATSNSGAKKSGEENYAGCRESASFSPSEFSPLPTCTPSPVSPGPTSRCTRSWSSLRSLLHTCTRSRSSQLYFYCTLHSLGCFVHLGALGLACTVCSSGRVGGSMQ